MSVSPDYSAARGLIERARRYLRKMPPAISGFGGDKATFHAVCVLARKFDLPEETMYGLMAEEYNPRCRPPWDDAQLRRKVRDAFAVVGKSTGPQKHQAASGSCFTATKWPGRDDLLRQKIIEEGLGIKGLTDRTGVMFCDDGGKHIAKILTCLFFSVAVRDPLICIAKTKSTAFTRPLSFWLADPELSSHSLIVPSMMRAVEGMTHAGYPSQRCLDNTGPRHYLVIEFDGGTLDEQASILWHLNKFGLLTMVVHSGNKSLHGWFFCRGEAEDNLSRFMRYAVRLGADSHLLTRCQLVRLPFGMRDNGVRQAVLYFNPSPILDREVPNG